MEDDGLNKFSELAPAGPGLPDHLPETVDVRLLKELINRLPKAMQAYCGLECDGAVCMLGLSHEPAATNQPISLGSRPEYVVPA